MKQRLGVLATLLLAFALRVYRLGYQELRGDEAFGYFFSLRPPINILQATIDLLEPHPTASYFVQRTWLAWAGDSEFALRFVSVWFGVLAVALLYRLAKSLRLPPGTALAGALLLAISPYAIWHSQDARMYSMSLALTTASTWLAIEFWQGRRRLAWLSYLLVTLLALHVHYFAMFVLLAQNVFALSLAVRLPAWRRRYVRWIGIQALVLILYLPWLLAVRETITGYRGNGDSPTLADGFMRAFSVFWTGETIPADLRPLLALLALTLVVLGAFWLARISQDAPSANKLGGRWSLWLLLLYLFVPLGATWWSAQSRPIFDERYLIAAAPPFLLLVAAGITESYNLLPTRGTTRPRWQTAVPVSLLVLWLLAIAPALSALYGDGAYSKTRGWRQLAAALEHYSAGLPPSQVTLAQNFPDPTLWYYYRGPVEHVTMPPRANDLAGALTTATDLVSQGVRRVILAVQPAPWWDDSNQAATALADQYALVAETVAGSWPVQIYSRSSPDLDQPALASFANGVHLTAFSTEPASGQPTVPGGVVVVHLDWTGSPEVLAGTEKIFLHLMDSQGELVAQVDRPFDPVHLQDKVASYAILLPDSLPEGSYDLIVGLYDPGQAGSPRISTSGGSDSVPLGSITVE